MKISWKVDYLSSHNNIFNYQSHLRPLSCQEVRIRCRLNTDSVEKALSHDSMFPNALHATAWCQAEMFHANLTWLLSLTVEAYPMIAWHYMNDASKMEEAEPLLRLQMHIMAFRGTHSSFFLSKHDFFSTLNTFWLLLFSFCTFPLSCYLATSFHEEHLQRFSWRLERSNPDMSHVKGPSATLKVKGSSLYCWA